MDKQARKAEAVTSAAEKPVNKLRSHRCRQTCPPDSIFVIYSSFRTLLIIDQRRNTSCDWAIRYRKNFSLTFCQCTSTPAHLSWMDEWGIRMMSHCFRSQSSTGKMFVPRCRVVIKAPEISTILDLSNSRLGRKWTECINNGWLRELEKKEKEVGKLLE